MISYLDRTFCASPNCTNACGHKPMPDVQDRAHQWWGGPGAPVAYTDFCDENGEIPAGRPARH